MVLASRLSVALNSIPHRVWVLAALLVAGCGTPNPATPSTTSPPDVDAIVFVDPAITPGESEALRKRLVDLPEATSVVYVDTEAAYEEFLCLFADQPQMVAGVSPAELPTSYRLSLRGDENSKEVVRRELRQASGVRDVKARPGTESTTGGNTRVQSGACEPQGARLR